MRELKFLKHMKQTDTQYNFLECELDEAIAELEEAMKPKTCEGCSFGKITLNSVICGKSGTYKEYDDYCKYHKQKDKA